MTRHNASTACILSSPLHRLAFEHEEHAVVARDPSEAEPVCADRRRRGRAGPGVCGGDAPPLRHPKRLERHTHVLRPLAEVDHQDRASARRLRQRLLPGLPRRVRDVAADLAARPVRGWRHERLRGVGRERARVAGELLVDVDNAAVGDDRVELVVEALVRQAAGKRAACQNA